MRNQILITDSWIDPSHEPTGRTYLDASDWKLFIDWVKKDKERTQNLIQGKWKVTIFNDQLVECFGEDKRRDKIIKQTGILIDRTSSKNFEMFITESLRAYFHSIPAYHPQAKLLALARRLESNQKIQIISQNKFFWRISDVDTYYIDEKSLKGFEDLPAYFDFFMDMKIHRKIWLAASERINNGDNPVAIIESVKTLFEQVRESSGLSDDGFNLMRDAFGCQQWQQNLSPAPLIRLSNLSSQTEWNEQKGYRDIACGIASALRNPIAHQPVDQAFIQARYGDKRTTLKVLCLLSLLLEKIDKRVI
jgi:uncharacterized protein (TIGR02391 family)